VSILVGSDTRLVVQGITTGTFTAASSPEMAAARRTALAECAQVHVENVALHAVADMFLGHQRFLGGVHAADAGAVVALAIPRADALDKGNPLRLPMVAGALDVAGIRSGCGQDPLELQRRDDVRKAAVAVAR